MGQYDVIQKTGSIQGIPQENRATAIGYAVDNHHGQDLASSEGRCYLYMYMHIQICDRQTLSLHAYTQYSIPTGDGVVTTVNDI